VSPESFQPAGSWWVALGHLERPIFASETKQPVEEINDKVWGQVFHYLGSIRVLGHPNPFVVFSTFDKSWLTWDAADNHLEPRFGDTLKQCKNRSSPFFK